MFKNLAVLKDSYLVGHQQRVAHYVRQIAQDLKINDKTAEIYIAAAEIHDIGKIGIPNTILFKASKLTVEEYELIKLHPVIGSDLIMSKDNALSLIIRHHHERWDGTGYPDGLKNTEIPLGSRLISVADAFDAMVTKRPYKQPLTKEEAFSELLINSEKQFDPDIAKAFIKRYSSKPFLIK